MAQYIFVTVAAMMFIFCTFYTFKGERRIIEEQNKFSEVALSELAVHIKDGFVYEKDEELSELANTINILQSSHRENSENSLENLQTVCENFADFKEHVNNIAGNIRDYIFKLDNKLQ